MSKRRNTTAGSREPAIDADQVEGGTNSQDGAVERSTLDEVDWLSAAVIDRLQEADFEGAEEAAQDLRSVVLYDLPHRDRQADLVALTAGAFAAVGARPIGERMTPAEWAGTSAVRIAVQALKEIRASGGRVAASSSPTNATHHPPSGRRPKRQRP